MIGINLESESSKLLQTSDEILLRESIQTCRQPYNTILNQEAMKLRLAFFSSKMAEISLVLFGKKFLSWSSGETMSGDHKKLHKKNLALYPLASAHQTPHQKVQPTLNTTHP